MSKPVFEDVFTFSGRRNRKSFVLYGLVQTAVLVGLFAVVLVAAASRNDAAVSGALLVCAIPLLALCVSSWAVAGQRCRDFGWSGWAALITVVPFVGWAFSLALYFVPGDDGENRYGADPVGGFRPGRRSLEMRGVPG